MNIQEIVFWSIFLIIASLLVVGQVLITNPTKNIPTPPQVVEYFPDVSKTDREAVLIYENTTYAEKLVELSDKKPIYGLGEYSGPSFIENMVKEGALQTAYQHIIKELDIKKEEIKKSLAKDFEDKKLEEYVDKLFSLIYQFLSNDSSLAVVYRIWRKERGQIVTYYMLTIFDDKYAIALLKSVGSDILNEFTDRDINFELIWQKTFNGEKNNKK